MGGVLQFLRTFVRWQKKSSQNKLGGVKEHLPNILGSDKNLSEIIIRNAKHSLHFKGSYGDDGQTTGR